VRDAVDRHDTDSTIRSLYSTSIRNVSRQHDGSLSINLLTEANVIDPETCVDCGVCLPACQRGAIRRVPGWGFFADETCDRCGACLDSCDFGAISMDRPAEQSRVDADAVIVASGFEPFDPGANRKWGYGLAPGIITATELERLAHDEQYLPPSLVIKLATDGARVAFLQCIGSRNVAEGVAGCSRVCCAYALRMARRLRSEFPELQIDFYYMDLQYLGSSHESFVEECRREIQFVRSNPISVTADNSGAPVVRFDSIETNTVEERSYDLIVLSHGITAQSSNEELAKAFGIDLTPEGFLSAGSSPTTGDIPAARVYVCGTASGPMSIAETVESATEAAGIVAQALRPAARSTV